MRDDPRFRKRIEVMESGCHEWTASTNAGGYGTLGREGKHWLAHRYAWTLERGPIPAGLKVLHTCDNPPCVRIGHLYLGTQTDNMRDRKRRTGYNQSREAHPRTHLTWDDVRSIRTRYAAGETRRDLADEFDVGPSTITAITTFVNWKE